MWGLAAAFGPVGWVVAAVGTAATVYAATSSSDEYETSTYSDKDERKSETARATKQEKTNKIYQDIQVYKSKQIKRFKHKYDVDIKFNSGTTGNFQGVSIGFILPFGLARMSLVEEKLKTNLAYLAQKISVNKSDAPDTITTLVKETEDMVKLIGELEVKQYETTS